jgi:hypothetical protein
VEVDQEEREDDPVPEGIHERPELEDVDGTGKARVERTQIRGSWAHGLNLARRGHQNLLRPAPHINMM